MTAGTLAGRRLWIGIPGPDLDCDTRRLLEDIRPGGVALFGRNIVDVEQVSRLVTDLRTLLGEDLRVSVDQEGGLVVRFASGLVVYPGNMALGAASVREPALGEHLAAQQGFQSACELRGLGIDVNLAPVLDLARRGDNPGVGVRSFGEHPELAEKLGSALVRGTLRGGVIPCLKHFPGLGEATVDPHLGLPTIQKGGSSGQIQPFWHALDAGAPLVMTSHAVHLRLDEGHPATFSRAIVTDLLRGQWGFGGAIMTDDLEMGAMTRAFEWDDVIRLSSAAGHDILVICHDADRQRRAHDLLTHGLEQGEAWFGDPEAVEQRLGALRPPAAQAEGDPDEGRQVAAAIAGRAVTVIRDDGGLLPLKASDSVLLALPKVQAETGVEDPLRGEDPSCLARSLEGKVTVHAMSPAPTASEVEALLDKARGFDRLLVGSTGARFEPAQAELLRAAVRGHAGAIVVPLRHVFDCEVLAESESFSAVTAYGFRPVHMQALADVLTGRAKPYGRLPITLRPE